MIVSNLARLEWIGPGVGFSLQRTHIIWYVLSNERMIASGAEGGPPCLCVSSI
jgi:hypothetical protein